MSTDFDPYREWLGIEPHEQPVSHYRLLGVTPFTHDLEAIRTAADQRMAHLRKYQMGPRGAHTQPLLNALAGAKLCLLNPSTKSSYDAILMAHLGMQHSHGDIRQPPPAVPPPGPSEPPLCEPPVQSPPAAPPPPPVEYLSHRASAPAHETFRPVGVSSRSSSSAETEEQEHEEGSPWLLPLGLAIGCVLLAIFTGGVFYVTRPDPEPLAPVAPITPAPPLPQQIDAATTPAEEPPQEVPDEPVAVGQEGDGSFRFAPSAAQLTENLTLENMAEGDRIAGWQAAGDQAAWMFRVSKPGAFKARLEYASAVPGLEDGGSFRLAVPGSFEKVRSISGGDGFKQDSFFVAITRSGTHRLEFTSDSIRPGEQFQLISVQLIPPGAD